ncbi:MAG TPA: ABC transporter ATP-binding protein [Tepidisphaeraceae bacterium]|nr:ABC transporter ATP-binding protein [Tepidisphaeraceae bacterium]
MALLEVDNVSVRFGGLTALSGFSFRLDAGELVGLIGPNGAGKTTAFNVVTGVYAPSAGDVRLGGNSTAGRKPFRINRLGIARTFQNIRLFGGLSALDNVLVGSARNMHATLAGAVMGTSGNLRREREVRLQALRLLRTFGLDGRARETADALPYGDQRRLEIARALATGPKILLLDEPAAGMNPQEKLQLMDLIRFVRDSFGVGIWLIEHDMKLVMSICQRITVLNYGQTIAVGTPQEVQNNQKVIEAYLGEPAGNA